MSDDGFSLPIFDHYVETPDVSLPAESLADLAELEPLLAPEPPTAPAPQAPEPPHVMSAPAPLGEIGELPGEPLFAPEVPVAVGDAGVTILDRRLDPLADGATHLESILLELLRLGGSDLHLNAGLPPMVRVDGDLTALPRRDSLSARQVREVVYSILTNSQKQRFEEARELDFAYELPGAARFRVNLMWQRGTVAAVFRVIPWDILPLEALSLPAELGELANLPRGLVLVTGPTGSGKSTTLAALVDRANRTRHGHIITIEDPIEFVHQSKTCVVSQREVGEDTTSFANALKHALRQDPDVILLGEMRDLETIATALTAAETGHLVFGTLHTSSAASTIDRIVDVFPPAQQAQVRTQLAGSLQAVVCQTLCRKIGGTGRAAATEVMLATPAIRNLIREGKLQSIPSALQTGARLGMHTLNQDLARLVADGEISYETAVAKCSDVAELDQLLGRDSDGAD